MTHQAQINKFRSAIQITVAHRDGLPMPTGLHDAVRVAFQIADRADRGEKVSAKKAKNAVTRISKAAEGPLTSRALSSDRDI